MRSSGQQKKQVNIRLMRVAWRALQAVAHLRNTSAQKLSERVLIKGLVRLIEGKHHAKS